jgi:glycosyltransferase involved in cell wall biosynthesis
VTSVIQQSYTCWELCIVDDGSNDQTGQWVRSLQRNLSKVTHNTHNKIELITHGKRQGVSAARNQGVSATRGDWLAFLDSDDEWLPKKLEMQMALARANPSLPLLHSDEIWVRNGVRVNPMKKHAKSGGRLFLKALPLCCISPSTAMIRRSLFNELGGFREDFPVCEDYELWLRICERHEVGFVEAPLIKKYGGHEDQLSRRYKAMDYWRVKALVPFLNSLHLNSEEQQALRHTIKKKCRILLKGYLKHNNMTNFEEISSYLNRL